MRLAKSVLADTSNPGSSAIFSKDFLIGIQRAATVFVSHLYFYAQQYTRDAKRVMVSTDDVLKAVERIQLAGFLPQIKHKLALAENGISTRKAEKLAAVTDAASAPSKKLKTNDKISVERAMDGNADDLDDLEEVVYGSGEDHNKDLPNDDIEEDPDADQDALDEEDTEEHVAPNPIAALSMVDAEVRGPSDTEDAPDTNSNSENED